MWKLMRRTCLVASIYGHGLLEEDTQVRILCSMCGVKAAQLSQVALQMAVKAMWVANSVLDVWSQSCPVIASRSADGRESYVGCEFCARCVESKLPSYRKSLCRWP